MKRMTLLVLFATFALAVLGESGEMPLMAQTVRLSAGWNAVYLKVVPDETPDRFFADWPVTEVGLYDPAAFTGTRQYASALDSEGVTAPGMRVWRKDDPDASTLRSLLGNAVYVCRASKAYETTIYGIPEAVRLTWHPASETNAVLNYIGVSLAPNLASVPIDSYFSGSTAGSTFRKSIYGKATDDVPQLVPIAVTTVSDGGVLAMDAATASDWSGTLYVQPASGVSFSTNRLSTSVSVRNDGATARTVRLSMRAGDAQKATDLLSMPTVYSRDTASAAGWTTASLASNPIERRLEAGETWTILLALDRSQFAGIAVGTAYGALLQFADVDGGSGFQTTIPLQAFSDGGETMRKAWPAGLWLCEATLTHVAQVVNDGYMIDVSEADAASTEAGGRMRVRLPIHIDSAGHVQLMQRVSVVETTNAQASAEFGLYAGAAAHPEGGVEKYRLSSVVLPTDLGTVLGDGTFGNAMTFGFTVGERSNVNPFRHARHPNHDGLRTDFKTFAPSGDVPDNYKSTVKPELFSITNEISLVWNDNGACAWSPEETLSGTCTWTFSNLRREADAQAGGLRARGKFTMQRIMANPVLNH